METPVAPEPVHSGPTCFSSLPCPLASPDPYWSPRPPGIGWLLAEGHVAGSRASHLPGQGAVVRAGPCAGGGQERAAGKTPGTGTQSWAYPENRKLAAGLEGCIPGPQEEVALARRRGSGEKERLAR